MKTFKEILLESEFSDLRNAKRGDIIVVGIQGTKIIHFRKIKEIRPDYVVDDDNNFFFKNGLIKRIHSNSYLKQYQIHRQKGNKISAKIATKANIEKQYKKRMIEAILNIKFDEWNKKSIEELESFLKLIRYSVNGEYYQKLIRQVLK